LAIPPSPFFAKKQACGLEERALREKSIGVKRIPPGDPSVLPQNAAGGSGAPPGAPTSESPVSWGKEKLARPFHGIKDAHSFCAQRPFFRAGQRLKFNRPCAHLAKSGGGQACVFY